MWAFGQCMCVSADNNKWTWTRKKLILFRYDRYNFFGKSFQVHINVYTAWKDAVKNNCLSVPLRSNFYVPWWAWVESWILNKGGGGTVYRERLIKNSIKKFKWWWAHAVECFHTLSENKQKNCLLSHTVRKYTKKLLTLYSAHGAHFEKVHFYHKMSVLVTFLFLFRHLRTV